MSFTEQQQQQQQRVSDGSHYEIVDPQDIYIDRYQRPLGEAWLKKREGKYDKAMAAVVILSDRPRRGKRYAAIDGQHRIELALREGVTEVAALVFENMTAALEAELFSRYQQERRNITQVQRFNADLVAENPQAKAIVRILRTEGLEISATTDDPGSIKCVRALERIYEQDPARLQQIIRVLQATWGTVPMGRNVAMVTGLAAFIEKTEAFDESRFIDRLSEVLPSAVTIRAQQKRDGAGKRGSLSGYVAETLDDEYRSRRRR